MSSFFSIQVFLISISFQLAFCWFEIEMPDYKVLDKIGKNIEIRKYNATKWVCTSAKGNFEELNSKNRREMFWTLFNYISSKNDQNKKIEMTAPVTMFYKNTKNELIDKNSVIEMTMKFYVPKENQNNTPTPTGNAFIEDVPEITVATIRYGGWASVNTYLSYRDKLIKKLGDEAKDYDTVNFISAGYDSPFNLIGRRNEVWLLKNI